MVFAKRVYFWAGVYGLIVCLPGFVNEPWVAKHDPPALNHPEYFYGFTVAAVAWQVLFLLLSRDVVRFRPLMPATFVEKFGYFAVVSVLYIAHRISPLFMDFAMIDAMLGVLFVVAYRNTPRDAFPSQ